MTLLTSLGRALAVDRGQAQRITTVRHLHVSSTPLVFVPLKMAGEASAPMAAMIGIDRENPRMLVVAQPRNRDQRFAFAHNLARLLFAELLPMTLHRPPVPGQPPDGPRRCADAPQIWVPNRAGVEFVRMLGRSTRFRKTTGQWAVPANVPRMGKWLTFYADRVQYPGSSLLVPATAALSAHWATGQSSEEDEHLGTVLAWLDPGGDLTGAEAAQIVEDPVDHPPAGPATDPTFDNTVLAPLVRRYHDNADNSVERARVESRIESALHDQLIGTWQRVWQAIDLLAAMEPGRHVAERWDHDLDAFTRTADWIENSPATQPKRDSAVTAAMRLYELERAQARYEAQRAFDDPLVMAEVRLAGEAFVGTVTAAEPYRRIGRRNLPLITVETADPVRLPVGENRLRSPARIGQKAELVSIAEVGDRVQVVLELSEGMGNGREPKPGSVPELHEEVCYSLLTTKVRRMPAFPRREETPWTHGGPPAEYVPTDEDAQEEWQ
ncbi:hypothetical protein [Micromonospora inositola]|uniref:Uncharacterized protein n=1 Tax=Micromonospora inositola TaxID=47865 RepID=A0A1C5K5N7_9ACTN|nr:hypothetical protein [Micromonospora inositola]SCG78090.1 hypothetical protein GA0070613_6461 [Micromonospora inositola]